MSTIPPPDPGDDRDDRVLAAVLRVVESGDLGPLAEFTPAERTGLESLADIGRIAAAYRRASADGGDASDESPSTRAFRWGSLDAIDRVGSGSFGEVWRAWDPSLHRHVALKLRRDDAGLHDTAAWIDEARRLARVRHPNVLTVHGADLIEGRAGIWTELLEGRTLEDVMTTQGRLGAREAALVGLDLCAALAAVHAAGLVHGDVKPANVMRVGLASGDPSASGRLVLMDFGAARGRADTLALGTPLATAPEVLAGHPAESAADVYSLGVLLFRLVTARWPVEASSLEELRLAHASGTRLELRAVRPDLPHEFVAAVARALEPDAASRCTVAELEQLFAPVLGPVDRLRPRAASRARVSAPMVWVTAIAVLSLAVTFWLRFTPPGGQPPLSENGGFEPVRTPSAPTPATERAPQSPAMGLARAPEVEATLLRVGDGARQPLHNGDPIAPGDRVALELSVRPAAFAYVLDEDRTGSVTVLFPLTDGTLRNPLPAAVLHRLPGKDSTGTLDWQVTSSGGQETFLIAVASAPIPELEAVVQSRAPAREGTPVNPSPLAPEALVRLRGVAGLTRNTGRPIQESALAALARQLAAARPGAWLRLVVLENP